MINYWRKENTPRQISGSTGRCSQRLSFQRECRSCTTPLPLPMVLTSHTPPLSVLGDQARPRRNAAQRLYIFKFGFLQHVSTSSGPASQEGGASGGWGSRGSESNGGGSGVAVTSGCRSKTSSRGRGWGGGDGEAPFPLARVSQRQHYQRARTSMVVVGAGK